MKMTQAVGTSLEAYYSKIPLPLFIVDASGRMIYKNALMEEWVYPGATYIDELLYGEDKQLCHHGFDTVKKNNEAAVSFEVRWLKQGTIQYVCLHASCIEENGQRLCLVNLQDVTEQRNTQTLLNLKREILEHIVKRKSLYYILQEISKKIETQLGKTTYCSVLLLDESKQRVEEAVAPNLPEGFRAFVKGREIKDGFASCGEAMKRNTKIIVPDISEAPIWENFRQPALAIGLHACWSVPICLDDEVVGSFALYHTEPATPTLFELELLEACARLAGLAIERSNNEKQLMLEKERRFQALIHILPDILIFKDVNGRWLEMNEAALEKFTAFQSIDYQGKNNKELLAMFPHHLDFFNHCQETDRLAWETGEVVRTEWDFTLASGEQITLDLMKVPLYEATGMPDGLLVIGRDITERKREALLVEEREQKYKSLFEHNPSGIYAVDTKGHIRSFNDSMEKMVGFSEEDLHQSIVPFICEEYVETTIQHFRTALQGTAQNFETVAIHKNGERIFLKVTNVPIVVQGEIVGVYGIAKDVTSQRKQNEELRRTKELLESVFHHSADCISILSLDVVVQDINAAVKNVFGWEPEEMRGRFCPAVPEHLRDEVHFVMQSIQEGKEVVGLETIRQKKDGSLIDVSITFSPLKDGQGKIIGMTAISRDISERRRTEELLSRSDKLSAIGQLAASIAHEIRNPLTSIKGFVQLFRNNIEQQFVDLMLSELERIEMIVTEFLLLAKPHATQFVEKNINAIVHQTLPIIEAQALMNKVDIMTSLHPAIPSIHCDENKVKQVLINVFQNALEAMPNGGTIYIHTEQTQDEVIIEVRDEGYGISQERIKKLGEPFYSNKEKGTGLGLMVCFKIMEEHGGEIAFSSQEGEGTTVRISFPLEHGKQVTI